jgi:shikimate kinase
MEMMQNYYDYHPTLSLSRPLVLVSFVNELTRAVANSLASTTGLPLRLLDDIVEHQLAASSVELLRGAGLEEWREIEKAELAKAVHAPPPAIVAIGEGALDNDDSLERVLAETDLVYLYLSFSGAQRRAVEQASNRKATLFAEFPTDGISFEDELMKVFSRRHARYGRAQLTVDVHGRTPAAVGIEILEKIE